MNKDNIRITFLGDVMFEKYILKKNPEETNFEAIFKNIETIVEKSDIVVGNIETTFSSKRAGYTKEMYSFNTPDKAATAIKKFGLDYAIITNNHIYDRGNEGRDRTIKVLEDNGIKVLAKDETLDIIEIEGVKLALLPFTSNTNYVDNKFELNHDDEIKVRLLNPYDYWTSNYILKGFKPRVHKVLRNTIGLENVMRMLKTINRKHNNPSIDNLKDDISLIEPYKNRALKNIESAKNMSDITIVLPHMGGQFNESPGSFSKYYMNVFQESNVDAVIASHPHIIQKYENKNGVASFYSIGNVSMAPNSTYIILDKQPEIGLIVHLDISKQSKQIERILLNPIKMEYSDGLKILPLGKDIDLWLQKRLQTDLNYLGNGMFEITDI